MNANGTMKLPAVASFVATSARRPEAAKYPAKENKQIAWGTDDEFVKGRAFFSQRNARLATSSAWREPAPLP